MDFDIGNLVYILITIAFVIFSAMKKKKRTVAKPIVNENDEGPSLTKDPEAYISEKLKNLFGDYLEQEVPENENEEDSVYGYVDNDYESQNVEYEEVLDNNYSSLDTIETEEGLSSTMQFIKDLEANNLLLESKSTQTGPSFTDEVMQDFDPRRAILFSEIFRPKYF